MEHPKFWFGMALVIAGCLIFIYRKESAAPNEVEIFGFRFKLSHPTLVIIVLGFVLIIREPFDHPPPAEVSAGPSRDDTQSPTKPPETVQPPPTDAGAGALPGSSSAPAADAAAPVADSSAATAADQSTPDRDRKAVDVAQAAAVDAAAAAAAPASAATNAAGSAGPSATASTPTLPGQATPAVTSPSSAWVYLGSLNGDSLPSQTFNLRQLPVPGQEIEAITPVNTREAAPALKEDKKWYFGRVTGLIKRGQRVSVRRVETIRMTEGEPVYIWAEVDATSTPVR